MINTIKKIIRVIKFRQKHPCMFCYYSDSISNNSPCMTCRWHKNWKEKPEGEFSIYYIREHEQWK